MTIMTVNNSDINKQISTSKRNHIQNYKSYEALWVTFVYLLDNVTHHLWSLGC